MASATRASVTLRSVDAALRCLLDRQALCLRRRDQCAPDEEPTRSYWQAEADAARAAWEELCDAFSDAQHDASGIEVRA
ncbi:MAG: hypothetical protein ACRDYZ_00745 [Acidimicrobiales bacterium]